MAPFRTKMLSEAHWSLLPRQSMQLDLLEGSLSMSTRFWALVLGMAVTGSAVLASPTLAKYKVEDVKDGRIIHGVAKWKGHIPKMPPLKVFVNQETCGETVPSPVLQIDKRSKGIRFVLVYIENIDHGKAPEALEVLHMGKTPNRPDSNPCRFEEHVFPYERKSVLGFVNHETLMHVVHGFTENGSTIFDFALTTPGKMVKHHEPRLKGVGLEYRCEIHAHMNGWLAGFNHPYFATTDRRGKFKIRDVPPGKYTLVAWHEGYNILKFDEQNRPHYDEPHIIKKEIEVKPGHATRVHFMFPVRNVKVDWKIAGE